MVHIVVEERGHTICGIPLDDLDDDEFIWPDAGGVDLLRVDCDACIHPEVASQ